LHEHVVRGVAVVLSVEPDDADDLGHVGRHHLPRLKRLEPAS
jgi:hypothetical protein